MNETNDSNEDKKFAAWQMRIDVTREKMAARKELLRERRKRETEKLYRLVGEICCKAKQRPDFGPPLKAVLESETDQRTQAYLREEGLL